MEELFGQANPRKCRLEVETHIGSVLAALPEPPGRAKTVAKQKLDKAIARGMLVEVGGKGSNWFQLASPPKAPADPDFENLDAPPPWDDLL